MIFTELVKCQLHMKALVYYQFKKFYFVFNTMDCIYTCLNRFLIGLYWPLCLVDVIHLLQGHIVLLIYEYTLVFM